MNDGMWMGTRAQEMWVPACTVSPDFSKVGVRQEDAYLNGGAGVRGSKGVHGTYNLTWNMKRREELRPVLDIAAGLYDRRDGTGDLVYFLDPFTLDANVLSPMYGAPMLGGVDGTPLLRDSDDDYVPPTLLPTDANPLGYPALSAQYTLEDSFYSERIYIPIPPGHSAWVGVHGKASGAGIKVTPYFDYLNAGTSEFITTVPVSDERRVTNEYKRSDGYSGIELTLERTDNTQVGNITLAAMTVQILKEGTRPFPGRFISGQGNGGCEFSSYPSETPYSAALDRVGMTAKLTEVGPWRQS